MACVRELRTYPTSFTGSTFSTGFSLQVRIVDEISIIEPISVPIAIEL